MKQRQLPKVTELLSGKARPRTQMLGHWAFYCTCVMKHGFEILNWCVGTIVKTNDLPKITTWDSKGKRIVQIAFPWSLPPQRVQSPGEWLVQLMFVWWNFPRQGEDWPAGMPWEVLGGDERSFYLQSKCSGRETTLPRIQPEAKHRWRIRLASNPWDGEAPWPGVTEEISCP